jgi:hypothetical protein
MAVREGWRGRFFEDFEVGDVYEHPTLAERPAPRLLSLSSGQFYSPGAIYQQHRGSAGREFYHLGAYVSA